MTSIHEFDDSQRNQINVAIVGSVSVGKSTLLNTIFAETFSDCKLKRTTMTPQVYFETGNVENQGDLTKQIRKDNTSINNNLIQKSEKGDKITMNDIKENKYIVSKIHDFSKLEKDIYLTIYDIPGLNDSQTKQLYYQYINDNFNKFDIIIFVVDIYSALNTSDECDILVNLLTNCKKNYEKFGIHNKVIILANKCDEMFLDKSSKSWISGLLWDSKTKSLPKLVMEEELQEMFEQLTKIVQQKVTDIFPTLEYKILPISSEDSYIYRVYSRDETLDLDIKYLNKFGYNEYGKTRWNRLDEPKKQSKIKELLSSINLDETLTITGFNGFRNTLNEFLSNENQKLFINNHITQGIQLINGHNKLDINQDIETFYKYYCKYNELSKKIKSGIDTQVIFKGAITKYLKLWQIAILNSFIKKIDSTTYSDITSGKKEYKWKLIQDSYYQKVKEFKHIIDNAKDLFKEHKIPIISELSFMINSSINHYYIDNINSKSKPVSQLFDHFTSLLKNKFKITKNLINNFFSNEDMINKSPNEIIEYIEKLEQNNILSKQAKQTKVLDILKRIYMLLGTKGGWFYDPMCETEGYIGNFKYLEGKYIPSYLYYTNLFWNKYTLMNEKYNGKIDELNYLAFTNIRTHGRSYYTLFYDKKEDILILEKYYIQLLETNNQSNLELEITTDEDESDNELSDEDNELSDKYYDNYKDGNLSEELDNALGLNNSLEIA